jgi:hypothetical protein
VTKQQRIDQLENALRKVYNAGLFSHQRKWIADVIGEACGQCYRYHIDGQCSATDAGVKRYPCINGNCERAVADEGCDYPGCRSAPDAAPDQSA